MLVSSRSAPVNGHKVFNRSWESNTWPNDCQVDALNHGYFWGKGAQIKIPEDKTIGPQQHISVRIHSSH